MGDVLAGMAMLKRLHQDGMRMSRYERRRRRPRQAPQAPPPLPRRAGESEEQHWLRLLAVQCSSAAASAQQKRPQSVDHEADSPGRPAQRLKVGDWAEYLCALYGVPPDPNNSEHTSQHRTMFTWS